MNFADELKAHFIRGHAKPRICRKPKRQWGAREEHTMVNSFNRYIKTEEGARVYLIAMGPQANGYIEGSSRIKFINEQFNESDLIQRVKA